MGFVGAAIDYSRATSVRTAMQTALDATAPERSPRTRRRLTPADLQPEGQRRFLQFRLFNRPEAQRRPDHPAIESTPQEGSFVTEDHRRRHGRPSVHQAARAKPDQLLRHQRRYVGHRRRSIWPWADNTGSMASTQHDAPQDRCAQSAYHAAERREAAGRREGRDRAIRCRCQRRHQPRQ